MHHHLFLSGAFLSAASFLSAIAFVASRLHGGVANADRIAIAVGDHLEGVLRQSSCSPTADIAVLDRDLASAISKVTDWELRAMLIQLQSSWREACGVTRLSRRLTVVSDSTRHIAGSELDARLTAADRGLRALADVRHRVSDLMRCREPQRQQSAQAC